MSMYKGKYLTPEPEVVAPTNPEDISQETPVENTKDSKRKVKKSTVIFYSIYGGCVAAIIIALIFLMLPLRSWLVKYEASQPEQKSAEVFNILFADPDWGVIYTLANAEDTAYEGKDAYVAYMEQKVGNQPLTYVETAAGLSGDHKYLVKLGDEKVATFTLTADPASKAEIVDWKLGTVEVFFSRNESVTINKVPGCTVYINGVALDDSYTIRTASTVAEDYLPDGIHGYRMEQQYLDGLLMPPKILVVDPGGSIVTMQQDSETGIYSPVLDTPNEMTEEERQLALNAAEANSLFAIRAISTAQLRKYFDPNSQIYADICNTAAVVQSYASYAFDDSVTAVSDFIRYSDSIFSARVTMQLNVTRNNGTVKSFEMNTTYFFTLNATGSYMVTNITNVDTTAVREQVRLTFMNTGVQLDTQMVSTDSKEISVPAVTAPEGQVLLGWALQEYGENGSITMTIVLVPDETGMAPVSADKLVPMTLYPVFGAAEEAAV